jgi:hypothetical protein
MSRSEPGRPTRRPLPRRDSTDEVEHVERWIIDDLEPLRHEEHTLR